MVNNLSINSSILNQFVTEIRDVNIQKDSLRFRKNMERIGEIFAYEISKTLDYKTTSTQTPLGIAESKQLILQPVIATILRAGLPLHNGFLNYFDQAQNAFISAFRKHNKDDSFEITIEYVAAPNLNEKVLILCDPMIASGSSMILTYKELIKKGQPKHTHIVCAIASDDGINYLKNNMPNSNYTIWCGAIDNELNSQSYIIPGLGDAGDLSYGNKL